MKLAQHRKFPDTPPHNVELLFALQWESGDVTAPESTRNLLGKKMTVIPVEKSNSVLQMISIGCGKSSGKSGRIW